MYLCFVHKCILVKVVWVSNEQMKREKKDYTSLTSSQKWNHVNEKLTLRMRRSHEWMAIILFDDFRLLMVLDVWSRLWEPHLNIEVFLYNWKLLNCWTPGFTPRFLVVSVLLIFLVFCCRFILFVFVLCLVPDVAGVSRLSILDIPLQFSLTFI
jgi:hypothetical protein